MEDFKLPDVTISHDLFTCAFEIYKKYDANASATLNLLEMGDEARAFEFAVNCGDPEVWGELARRLVHAEMVDKLVDAQVVVGVKKLYEILCSKTQDDQMRLYRENFKKAYEDATKNLPLFC